MKYNKIIEEINNRIEELENKKKQLNIKEMSIAKRNQLEKDYYSELEQLYKLKSLRS